VTEAVTALGWHERWIGAAKSGVPHHTGAGTAGVRAPVRLVRKHRDVLLPTKLGRTLRANPLGLWWHVADRLPDARSEVEADAGLLLLAVVASLNTTVLNRLLHTGMAALGWHAARTGEPLDEWQAFTAGRNTWTALRRLGGLPEDDWARRPHRPLLLGSSWPAPRCSTKTDESIRPVATSERRTSVAAYAGAKADMRWCVSAGGHPVRTAAGRRYAVLAAVLSGTTRSIVCSIEPFPTSGSGGGFEGEDGGDEGGAALRAAAQAAEQVPGLEGGGPRSPGARSRAWAVLTAAGPAGRFRPRNGTRMVPRAPW
jgi:hypothetical protein